MNLLSTTIQNLAELQENVVDISCSQENVDREICHLFSGVV